MTAGGVQWSYAGSTGPAYWGMLSPEYAPCDEGITQSPVDITGYERAAAPTLTFTYEGSVSGASLVHGSVVVEFGPGSSLTLAERRYELRSAHAHTPAEHRVDGEEFAAELHVVHEDASGDALVVGVLFRSGPPSTVLQAMLDGVGGTAAGFTLDAAGFTPSSRAFYNYTGSKTTPPCQEPVEWVVMCDADTVSQEQVSALQAFSGGPNNRPVQPLGGRGILLVEG